MNEKYELDVEIEDISYYLKKNYIRNPEVTFQTYVDKRVKKLICSNEFIKESEIYMRGNIDRKLYSKIKNVNKEYKPSKKIVLAYCIALGLNVGEACNLMWMVGYHFEENNLTDQIVKFCLERKIYSAETVNKWISFFAKEYQLNDVEYVGSVMYYNKEQKKI